MQQRQPKFAEQRKNRRVPFDQPVSVELPGGEVVTMKALDYCIGGIGVAGLISAAVPNLGDTLKLRLSVMTGTCERVLQLRGRVKHIELRGGGYLLGVGFARHGGV